MLDELAKIGNIFTVDEALRISGIRSDVLWVMLSRLESGGWIERIERGKYMIIPLGAEKGKYTMHEFVIASLLADPFCIAYWSALDFHGLTEQMPRTVFVETTSRRKRPKVNVFGVDYYIVRVKNEKFFGNEQHWIEGASINITDPEKTIVDCLDRTRLCGGVIEVAKALAEGGFDKDKLIHYSIRINNSGVIRRLGYLADHLDLGIDVPKVDTRNYLCLDPSMPHRGPKNARWRLIVNIDEMEWGNIK